MDVAAALAFAREHHHAVLATMRRDGTPQMSPVVVGVDDGDRIVVSTRETAMKVANVRRDPRAWVCVLPDGFYGRWVWCQARVEVVSLPEALEPLVDYYRSVAGDHENWDAYREAMRAERRCLLRLAVERAGPDVSG